MKPIFIRAYWGDLNEFDHKNEIKAAALNKELNEIVYVWGKENEKFIKSFGYKTRLMSEMSTEYGSHFYLDSDKYMIHKLASLKRGIYEFDEVIFLDWDCIQIKKIDDKFFKLLKYNNSEIQMPLYSYPKNYSEIIFRDWKNIPQYSKLYVERQQNYLEKHHYLWNDEYVTPNAGFIYCNSISIIEKLLDIKDTFDIQIATEEMAFVEYAKQSAKTIDEYIARFEPIVCNGKADSHFNQKYLREHIESLMKKDIYFVHE